MLDDPYKISSNFRPSKGAAECKIKEFYEMFEDFYTKLHAKKNPDLPHKMCDPHGFALLCKDYEPIYGGTDSDKNVSCEDIINVIITTINLLVA